MDFFVIPEPQLWTTLACQSLAKASVLIFTQKTREQHRIGNWKRIRQTRFGF
jgi:hypothetical protein